MLLWNFTFRGLCFPSQYFPAAPYFAANNMSFYKVMSNDNGYKHLQYVEAVSNVLFCILFLMPFVLLYPNTC